MKATNKGGPAFPIQGHSTRNGQGFQLVMADGMTLRDYFAAAFVSSGHIFVKLSAGNTPEEVAKQSYALADAMLKARDA